jgi:hypothetical protein
MLKRIMVFETSKGVLTEDLTNVAELSEQTDELLITATKFIMLQTAFTGGLAKLQDGTEIDPADIKDIYIQKRL